MTERYFFAEQDRTVRDCIRLEGFDAVNGPRKIPLGGDWEKINDATFLSIKPGREETVLDFYQSPVLMVSARIRQVFARLEPEIQWKRVYLVCRERESSYPLFIPLIPMMDGLSSQVSRYPDGRERQVILDCEKCRGRHVFFLQNSAARRPIMSLQAAEAIFREDIIGLNIQEVEVS